MKKFTLTVMTVFCAFTLAACGGGTVAPSYSTPWGDNASVYEQSTYLATREKVSGVKGNYTYDTVASGTQTITLKKGTEKDTIVFTVDRDMTYVKEDKVTDDNTVAPGTKITSHSEIVFSCEATKMMQVKSCEKKLTDGSNPDVDLDYSAVYGTEKNNWLTITDHKNGDKKTTYKYGQIKNAFDNDMWYLLVRYGADFKKSWMSSMTLVSIADTLYQNRLSQYNVTATAAAEAQNLPLTALTENIRLSDNDALAHEDDNGQFYASALDVTISHPGEMGAIRGPSFRASFISDRRVDRLPLANLMLEYQQDEYTTTGVQTYRNMLKLSSATITED